MRRFLAVTALAGLLTASASASTAAKPKSHGHPVSGTILRVDSTASDRTLRIRDASSHEIVLAVTGATHITGGALNPGARVAARWLEKDGRRIATSIRVEPPAIAGVTPATPPPHTR